MYCWIRGGVGAAALARSVTAFSVAASLTVTASSARADTVCGAAEASWNVPAGAVVFSRSPGPVRDVIDAAGESRSHSMLSHGLGGASHASMVRPGRNDYSTPF